MILSHQVKHGLERVAQAAHVGRQDFQDPPAIIFAGKVDRHGIKKRRLHRGKDLALNFIPQVTAFLFHVAPRKEG